MSLEGDLERTVIAVIREVTPRQFRQTTITPDTRLQRDLGLDSLGIAALLFRLEGEFSLDLFGDPELSEKMSSLRSVGDLISLADALRN